MTSGEGALSGSGPQTVYINVYRTGQNYAGNYSSYHIQVIYRAKSYGSWTNTAQSWSANAGGIGYGGSFTIPSPGTSDITLLEADFNKTHDSNGFLSGFTSSATITTNHSSIGSGSVSVPEAAPPRIPKAPVQNGASTVSGLYPTQATLTWPANTDNRGAAIDQYLVRVNTHTPADSAGYTDYPVSASTLSTTVTGLTPGTQYYSVVYAHNSQGYSPKSSETSFKTPSGFYRWTGSTWAPTELLTWDGTQWRSSEVYTRKSTGWELAQ